MTSTYGILHVVTTADIRAGLPTRLQY